MTDFPDFCYTLVVRIYELARVRYGFAKPIQTVSRREIFRYPPLMHNDSIRLLVLEPAATVEAELKATLSLVRLHNKPTYEAISYAWGPPVFPERIQLVNGRLKITESLSSALLRFRLRDGRRSLWADSVCNQEDKKEQNHQVKIMAMITRGLKVC